MESSNDFSQGELPDIVATTATTAIASSSSPPAKHMDNADNNNNNNASSPLHNALSAMGNQAVDDAILRYQDEIEREVAGSSPLVADVEDFGPLLEDYKNDAIFSGKIHALSSRYSRLRRTRGDGNCFYRALAFRLCEQLTQPLADTLVALFRSGKRKLVDSYSYPEFSIDDFCSAAVEVVEEVCKSPASILETFQTSDTSDYFVVYLRMLTALMLLESSELFEPVLQAMGYATVNEFCKAEVEPMGRDCDEPQMLALAQYLGVRLRIEYLDRNAGQRATTHEIPDPESDGASLSAPLICLLYRPGHYDILYQHT